MKVSFFALIDALFSGFIFFIVSLFSLNYFFSVDLALLLSILFSLPICFIALKRLNTKKQLFFFKKQQQFEKEQCVSNLNLLTKNQITDLFFDAIYEKTLQIEKRNGAIFIHDKKVALFFYFSFDGVSKTDVVRVFNSIPKNYKAYIFSDTFSQDTLFFISRFDKRLTSVDGYKTYKFLKEKNHLPPTTVDFSNKKLRFSCALNNFFQRKNAKRFLSFGAMLLLFSFLVPIKIYYLLFGCAFLTLSLICRLFGKN